MPCRGRTSNGKPCGAPEALVGEDGFCRAHAPGGRELMAEAGRLGGEALRRKYASKGLDPGALGPLESHDDAKRWLRIAGEAVAVGKLTDRQANAVSKAVSEWVKAESGRVKEVELAELRAMVAELKRRDGLRMVR